MSNFSMISPAQISLSIPQEQSSRAPTMGAWAVGVTGPAGARKCCPWHREASTSFFSCLLLSVLRISWQWNCVVTQLIRHGFNRIRLL